LGREIFPEVVGVPLFVDDTEDIEDVTFDLVADHVRKGPTFSARETMWTDVVAAFPLDDRADDFFDAVVEVFAETRRNS